MNLGLAMQLRPTFLLQVRVWKFICIGMALPGRAASEDAFPYLEVLDISHNNVQSKEDIIALESVPNLKRLILAGNPILANKKNGLEGLVPESLQDVRSTNSFKERQM